MLLGARFANKAMRGTRVKNDGGWRCARAGSICARHCWSSLPGLGWLGSVLGLAAGFTAALAWGVEIPRGNRRIAVLQAEAPSAG